MLVREGRPDFVARSRGRQPAVKVVQHTMEQYAIHVTAAAELPPPRSNSPLGLLLPKQAQAMRSRLPPIATGGEPSQHAPSRCHKYVTDSNRSIRAKTMCRWENG